MRAGAVSASRQSVQAQTGAEAVEASQELRKYKEANVIGGKSGLSQRQASGRTFVRQNKLWTDQTIEGRSEV